MKIISHFETKARAVKYLVRRGWVATSDVDGVVTLANTSMPNQKRRVQRGRYTQSKWFIFAS